MSSPRKTLVVGQSGGATAVINSTLAGVIDSVRETGRFSRVLGMRFSFEGLLQSDLVDLTRLDQDLVNSLRRTPSAALGTSRQKLDDAAIALVLTRLRELDAGALVLIGGNDSADSAHRVHRAAADAGFDLSVVAAPKTIDNDLPMTDHCPGYASLAKFLANAVRDATYDSLATTRLHPVKFIEVMGRDAGWVAAACALGFGETERDLQPLIFLPEYPPVSTDAALEEIQHRVNAAGFCVCVIPETLRDASNRHFGGETPEYVDSFGHAYYPSAAAALTRLVQEKLHLRARYERPGTAARMSISLASPIDLEEAYRLGWAAAARAASGARDIMVTLDRISDTPYQCAIGAAPLTGIANQVRPFPDGFASSDRRGISESFRAYALPLLGDQPFPAYVRIGPDYRI